MFGFTKRPLSLIAWKNLKTYPVRIFLTTSSIILGVAVIIASNIFSESNKSAFDNLFSGIYEGVDLVVQPIQEDFAEGLAVMAVKDQFLLKLRRYLMKELMKLQIYQV